MKQAVILGAVLALLVCGAASAGAGEIHPALDRELAQTPPEALVRVYVVFQERVPFEQLQALSAGVDKLTGRERVVSTLKSHAARTQAAVRAYVDSRALQAEVVDVRQIWMGNVLAFQATPDVIRNLTGFDEIATIHFDAVQPDAVDAPAPVPGSAPPRAGTPLQQGLILLRAQDVWNRGYFGQGIVVANIDTGTDYTHPDLINNTWINGPEDLNNDNRFTGADINGIDDDGNGYVDDVVGYDFGNGDSDPMDSYGHGTATAGQVAGDGTNGLRTGVAPSAKIMCLKPWDSSGSTESWIWEAMQYAVDNGVDVTTSSLSYKWAFSPKPNYPMWRVMTDVELAAGVQHTNSVGNQGGSGSYPIPYNISTPGNCPSGWIHPDQTLQGGISSTIGCGNVDAFDDTIENSSGRGPAAWEDIQATHPEYPYEMPLIFQDYPYETVPGAIGLIKPDIAAPGASTEATTIGGGYGGFGGTSSATPHTAGVIALMLSANPALTPADISRILQLSSLERGAPGKDNEYGAGRIDAPRAVAGALGELAPTISSYSVTEIPMYAQSVLTITGDNFLAGTEVEFDGIAAINVTVDSSTQLTVTTPIFPSWELADVTVRSQLGETIDADAVEFIGSLTINTANIRIGENVNFTMRGPASARWGYIINTETSNCTLKGIDFEVCPLNRLAISKNEQTNVVGSAFVNWPVPNDPGLIGETLYIQAGIDGNGTLPGKPWRATNVDSGTINP